MSIWRSSRHVVWINVILALLFCAPGHDAFGNRVAKTVNGVTTKYRVEDEVNPTGYPQVLDELTNGVVTRTYTYGLQRISEDQIISNAWTPSFYGYDGGGNVRYLSNAAGTVTDTYEYDAFGNKVNSTGTTPNNYLYRGEQYDSDLGLYYLRARYYNPNTGRFLSEDPLGFAGSGPNLYEYAGDDPIDFNDPFGLQTQICTSILHPHTYLCVNGDCGGFYPLRPFPWWSAGRGPATVGPPSSSQKNASCGNVPPPKNPQCFDQCVQKQIDNTGPTGTEYNVFGNNCGQWAENVITQCRAQCSK